MIIFFYAWGLFVWIVVPYDLTNPDLEELRLHPRHENLHCRFLLETGLSLMLPPLSGVFQPSTEFLISGFSFSSSSGWRHSWDLRAGPRHAAWHRVHRRYRWPSRKCFAAKLTSSECCNWRNSFPDRLLRHDWQRGDAFDWRHSLRRHHAVTLSRRRCLSELCFSSSTEIRR